ncbi:zinc ribbon domain-containing protein YjdM [Bernardetia sp. Wsw4-3y2]|uniref:zinc ribbon domain-containing protein YjdM n=1 Tax=Bernardetia sp. Wsw4-3y2 TaxID=3127471 RepID=UPI0030CC2751
MQKCPSCDCPYGYAVSDDLYNCPECSFEWNPNDTETAKNEESSEENIVIDANGNPLQDGDDVVIVKDLPVKGAPKPIKAGTKVKNIRITDGDHNIDCKITGFGSMALKSEFVKKA